MVSTRRTAKNGVAPRAAAVARQRQRATASGSQTRRGVPDIYEEMLAEAGVGSKSPEPPRKRPKRPGERSEEKQPHVEPEDDDSDGDVEFEDVEIPAPVIQTTELDSNSDDDEDDDELVFEDVELTASEPTVSVPQTLELNLTAQENALEPMSRRRGHAAARRKPLSRAERAMRLDVHKVHVLCLLAHAARRNRWCNRADVQAALRPLLTDKMRQYLRPERHLSQFGQTESLKNGLQQAASAFRGRFAVTERGLRRALWAESEDQLRDYELPADAESVLDADDFLAAARTLQGSRDVGAQLFCALLRAAGLEARLVCSLQPLAFSSGAPTLPKAKPKTKASRPPVPPIYESREPEPAPMAASPLRRLGHPQAAAYHIPSLPARPASSSSVLAPPAVRGESPFPVYWVEVLDVAHQKWQPIDPLVTHTQWRPARLEPPASDRANLLAYVVGFGVDRSAKDVTRRYAKAFNAKTRRWRVDGPVGADGENKTPAAGHRWLRRALRRYQAPQATDVDTIEDAELAAAEAREPMPRNLADFQNHPVYALERHLRRHEVLVPGATVVGTVAAGGPHAGTALSERIYRRRDVRIAYTADRWYRQGRVVLPNEIPAKWLKGRRKNDDDDDGEEDVQENVPAYTPEQTELYRAPPVVDGRVPKNKFGNIDVYVPSMVPAGGVHVRDDGAARAAFLLGVDYAPALTGFRFDGEGGRRRRRPSSGRRHGTAVLQGAVVAAEHAEAVRAVLAGLADLEAAAEAERRTRAALRAWAAFLRGLRIRSRIRAAAEGRGEEVEDEDEVEDNYAKSDDTEEYDMVMDDDMAGGFLVE